MWRIALAIAIIVATACAASADPLIDIQLPYGTSSLDFSIAPVPNDQLAVYPSVTSLPGGFCDPAGFNACGWNVGVTVDFYDKDNTLLSSNMGGGEGGCISGAGCSINYFAGFAVPIDATSFLIINDVSVFNAPFLSASEDIFTASQISEIVTPLPSALPLLATGLGALGLFGWRRNRDQISRRYCPK